MQHIEQHFSGSDTVRDVVIGMADGLTVPFALAAGISGALTSTHIVVTAGLAEIAAGSIAMGLGGYLAARGDVEHFLYERRREEQEIVEKADVEKQEIVDLFHCLMRKVEGTCYRLAALPVVRLRAYSPLMP